MDINKMTEIELKALAFDELNNIEIAKANLQAIYAQIDRVNNDKKPATKK